MPLQGDIATAETELESVRVKIRGNPHAAALVAESRGDEPGNATWDPLGTFCTLVRGSRDRPLLRG